MPRLVSRSSLLVMIPLVGVFALVAGALIIDGRTPARMAYDQNGFHLQAIHKFASGLPGLGGFGDYSSATTPGYHLVLAVVSRYLSDQLEVLKAFGALFTIGLLATIALATNHRAARPSLALAVCLPVAASIYVLASGVWLLPDNAAWWMLLFVLLVALRPRVDGWTYAVGACVLTALVLVRQIHIWSLGILLAAAWLGGGSTREPASTDTDRSPMFSLAEIHGLWTDGSTRLRRAMLALLAAAPAVAVLGYFVILWGGLTPPTFQTAFLGGPDHAASQPPLATGNPATPAFILALLGVYGVFFAPLLWRPLMTVIRSRKALLAAALLVSLLAAAIPATTFNKDAGRWTALWSVVERAPVIAGHTSVLILALAAAGALTLLAVLQGLSLHDRWIILAAILGFTAAQSVNHECWQRYIEPFLLMLLALAAVRIDARYPADTSHERHLRTLGPLALAALLAAVSYITIRAD